MEKKMIRWHGKKYYLLGSDREGTNYWLEEGHFDCEWYWGFGYVETFTSNENPTRSRDINSHSHFDSMFFNKKRNGFDEFTAFFEETPLSRDEIWRFIELMKSFYTAREYSDMIFRGGSHYTQNPVAGTIMCETEYKRINETVIPAIMNEVYEILKKPIA